MMKNRVVAIVGPPNVGKSTLFNRILGRRVAIVENIPGVTRDRHYAQAVYGRETFTLVDTGGLIPDTLVRENILPQIRAQTRQAIEESDVLIALFDGRTGMTPADQEVVTLLRQIKKPVFYAVNKIDTPKMEGLVADFYKLGLKAVYPLSADHGLGIDDLMEAVLLELPALKEDPEEASQEFIPKIAVVGRPNVGKSTLINVLLDENRLVTDNTPGTTRDAIDSMVRYDGRNYQFIDTAGIRRRGKVTRGVERYGLSRALEAIERCDLAVVVIDAQDGIVEQDTKIIGLALKAQKACLILVNKWDLRREDPRGREQIFKEMSRRLVFIPYAGVLYLSALNEPPVGEIFERINTTVAAFSGRIPTGALNRAFEKAVTAHTPPLVKGRPVKLNYITQVETRPPTFLIFANRPEAVRKPYLRYLENFLRETFDFVGSPLVIRFRKKNDSRFR